MDNLNDIFGEQETETPKPSLEETQEKEKPKDEEILKKQTQLDNLQKAIQEAEAQLRKKRQKPKPQQEEEEELPRIDDDDPSAKAWNKRINEKVAPMQSEIEQAKAERRQFALKSFLQNKPAIVTNADKMKQLMDTYEKIKVSSELTTEGILMDIERAYAADNYQEILATQDNREFEQAELNQAASDIGVSRGATGYASRRESSKIPLSDDDKAILAKWNMTPEQWVELKKKHG